VIILAFNYDKLWAMLSERDITNDKLRVEIACSPATIVKMSQNGDVSLSVIGRICKYLKCIPTDIMDYIPDNDEPQYIRPERKKGDIFLFDIMPQRDGRGNENAQRICLIYQADSFINDSFTIMTIPISYKVPLGESLTDIEIKPNDENNMKVPFVLRVGEMRTLRQSHLMEKLGRLSEADMKIVDKACAKFFGI
jgi:DNA-binding Xre family transcriptional regulator/mRNA-degrading endonuclease toxin of MazEF toxin-antitoxin module